MMNLCKTKRLLGSYCLGITTLIFLVYPTALPAFSRCLLAKVRRSNTAVNFPAGGVLQPLLWCTGMRIANPKLWTANWQWCHS